MFPIAYGTQANMSSDTKLGSDLQRIATASQGRLFDAREVSDLNVVLGQVLSTF